MFLTKFKAGFAYAQKDEDEQYYIVGLAEDEFDYTSYLIFQKSFDADESGDIFIDCNGDQCINACSEIAIDACNLTLVVQNVKIIVDIKDLMLPSNFVTYLTEIFGDLMTK